MIVLLTAFMMFTLVAISDGLWTLYIKATSDDRRMLASVISSTLILIGGISILVYVNNPWMIIPEMIGAFVGTWFVMTHTAKKKKDGDKQN